MSQVAIASMDHDFTKAKVTPSVSLICQIPESADASFYRGHIYVHPKDAIFYPSSALRHAWDICDQKFGDRIPPVLGIYSYGGPDHNPTHASVQLAHIAVFMKLDLDILIAVRTAPGGSYLNPVERIMSILNIALQGVALERGKMTEALEKVMSNCNSMADVRSASTRCVELKDAFSDSMQPVLSLMCERFGRIQLKEEPIIPRVATASEKDLADMFSMLHTICPSLNPGMTTKKVLDRLADLQEFLKTHSRIRHYCFQVRKCGNCTMCSPYRIDPEFLVDGKLPWLPDPTVDCAPTDSASKGKEVYLPFGEVANKDTIEEWRPSLQQNALSEDSAFDSKNKAVLVAAKVRTTVTCTGCDKPRCVYSQSAITLHQIGQIHDIAEDIFYVCGSPLSPNPNCPYVIRRALTCEFPVEVQFYSSKKFSSICSYCCSKDCYVVQELKEQHQTVLPICRECEKAGKTAFVRGKLQRKRPSAQSTLSVKRARKN